MFITFDETGTPHASERPAQVYYTGWRQDEEKHFDVKSIDVITKTGKVHPLRHVVLHSPDGMEWGYAGSGPADLALSILSHAFGPAWARKHYQDFKYWVVARLPALWWVIPRSVLDEFKRMVEEPGPPTQDPMDDDEAIERLTKAWQEPGTVTP